MADQRAKIIAKKMFNSSSKTSYKDVAKMDIPDSLKTAIHSELKHLTKQAMQRKNIKKYGYTME